MSSLIFLGFSTVAFIISFGVVFYIAPVVLGGVDQAIEDMPTLCCGWEAVKDDIRAQEQWLLPLIMLVGMFIFVLKVLMVASVRGRD